MTLARMATDTDVELAALKDFADGDKGEIGEILEDIIGDVARTGQYIHPWNYLKHLYSNKIDKVTSDFLGANPPLDQDGANNDELTSQLEEFRKSLISMFDKFRCAPFTIQRISELLVNPNKHYKSSAKFLRGLEKNILVVSTVESVTPDQRPPKRPRSDTIPEKDQNGFSLNGVNPPMKKSQSNEALNMPSEQETKTDESKDTSSEKTNSEEEKQDDVSTKETTNTVDHKDTNSTDSNASKTTQNESKTKTSASGNEQLEMNLASDEVMSPDEKTESKPSEEDTDQIVPVQDTKEEVANQVSSTQAEVSSSEEVTTGVSEAKEEQMEVDEPAPESIGAGEGQDEHVSTKNEGQKEDTSGDSNGEKKDVDCESCKEEVHS